MSWSRDIAAGFFTIPAATKVLLTTVVLSNPGIGETVRRTRGRALVQSDQGAAQEGQLLALGLIVVSDLALAAGAASIPGPAIDASDDGWFLWEPLLNRMSISTVSEPRHVEFDSKGMRKIQEGFGIAVMVENSSPTFGAIVGCGISILTSLS